MNILKLIDMSIALYPRFVCSLFVWIIFIILLFLEIAFEFSTNLTKKLTHNQSCEGLTTRGHGGTDSISV